LLRAAVLLFALSCPLFAQTAPVASPMPAPAKPDAVVEPLQTAGDRPIDIANIRLDLTVDLPKKTIAGVATLDFRMMRDDASFALDAVGFTVSSVDIVRRDGKPATAKFRHDGKKLRIECDNLAADDRASVRIAYVVREPRDGLFFFGPTEAEPDVPLTVWSQGEAITNRYWIPCLDHPDQRQASEMKITVPTGYEGLSNGKLVSKKDNGNGTTTFDWKQTENHPSYLITLVVGKFAVVEETWRGLPVLYYVPEKRKDDVARTFGRTRAMLDFFSAKFGVNYPWEKYAQVVVEQFTSGGMENTSATTLNDRVLHDARSFLDSSGDGLIAHELAHQWFGDLITARDWAHVWLNEGFASFCEVIWAEEAEGAEIATWTLWQKSKAAIAGGKERPIVDRRYASPRMMFDARAYPKGAWVLHMLRRQLGEAVFWKCIRTWSNEQKFRSVETSDLRRTCERISGQSLEKFFVQWTERPGHPVLEVASEYVASDKAVKIAIRQTQPGEAFEFPLEVRIGSEVRRLTVSSRESTLVFPVATVPTSIEIDPNQSVLMELKETKGRDLWVGQLRSPSQVSRIRAAQNLAKSKASADLELLAAALAAEKTRGAGIEMISAIAESGGTVARDALILGLKHENPYLRRACADGLAKFNRDAIVLEAVRGKLKEGDASYFVEAAVTTAFGKLDPEGSLPALLVQLRKESYSDVIRSAALSGMGQSKNPDALEMLVVWSKKGHSRPARLAALSAMVELNKSSRATEPMKKLMVETMTGILGTVGEMPAIRRATISGLRDLGPVAVSAVEILEGLKREDPDEFVQDLIGKAIAAIQATGKGNADLAPIKDEVEKLKKDNRDLRERLERLEKPKG